MSNSFASTCPEFATVNQHGKWVEMNFDTLEEIRELTDEEISNCENRNVNLHDGDNLRLFKVLLTILMLPSALFFISGSILFFVFKKQQKRLTLPIILVVLGILPFIGSFAFYLFLNMSYGTL